MNYNATFMNIYINPPYAIDKRTNSPPSAEVIFLLQESSLLLICPLGSKW